MLRCKFRWKHRDVSSSVNSIFHRFTRRGNVPILFRGLMESFCRQCNYHLPERRVFLLVLSFSFVRAIIDCHQKKRVTPTSRDALLHLSAVRLEIRGDRNEPRCGPSSNKKHFFLPSLNGPPTVPFLTLSSLRVNEPARKFGSYFFSSGQWAKKKIVYSWKIVVSSDQERSIFNWDTHLDDSHLQIVFDFEKYKCKRVKIGIFSRVFSFSL